jgi:hypothetical protein
MDQVPGQGHFQPAGPDLKHHQASGSGQQRLRLITSMLRHPLSLEVSPARFQAFATPPRVTRRLQTAYGIR